MEKKLPMSNTDMFGCNRLETSSWLYNYLFQISDGGALQIQPDMGFGPEGGVHVVGGGYGPPGYQGYQGTFQTFIDYYLRVAVSPAF